MRHYRKYFLTSILVVTVLALTGCNSNKNEMSTTEAENMINAAFEAKQFERMLSLADSLEKAGILSKGESYYWQGYANYQMGQRELAEYFWQESMRITEKSTDANDLFYYAKSASYRTIMAYLKEELDVYSLDNIQRYLLKKYRAHQMLNQQDSINQTARPANRSSGLLQCRS